MTLTLITMNDESQLLVLDSFEEIWNHRAWDGWISVSLHEGGSALIQTDLIRGTMPLGGAEE